VTKQINLAINGKGGVGKSVFATNIVQYLKDRRIAHQAIDSDHENSTLKRFDPDSDFINLEQRRQIDHIFIVAEATDLLAIDCPLRAIDRSSLPLRLRLLAAGATVVGWVILLPVECCALFDGAREG
jgi:cellulose biosynthesis protein BcsQ